MKIDKRNWEKVKFGDVCSLVNENTKNAKEDGLEYNIGLEHITPTDLHIRSWNTTDIDTTFTRIFRKGQVLFGRRRAYQRKVAYAEFDGICSGDIMVFQAKEDKLLPKLLPFIVQSDGFFQQAVDTSAGSLSPRTKFTDLANYEFLLPPKEEQTRLAELLWAADEVVEKEKQVKDKLDASRKSLMKDLFFKIEEKKRLSELNIKEINGLWKTDEIDKTIDVNIIRSTEFSDYGKIDFSKLSTLPVKKSQYKSRKLFPNDIILERSGGGPDQPVGRVCFFERETGEYSFSNFTSCLRVNSNSVVLPKYLFYFLQYFWEMKGTDRIQNQTTGIRNLDYDLYKRIKIPVCKKDTQVKVISQIDDIHNIIEKSIVNSIGAQLLKSSLINQIF